MGSELEVLLRSISVGGFLALISVLCYAQPQLFIKICQGQRTEASSPPGDAHMMLSTTFNWVACLNYCGWERYHHFVYVIFAQCNRQQPPGAPVGAIARRRRTPKVTPKVPLLEVKYGGDPKELGFFLAQVWNHMEEYGEDFSSEAAKVRCLTRALEGTAAKWMVTLHNDNDPLLMNYDLFTTALWARFEDPLAERKARIRMKTINQGRRSVAEYTQEFRELAYHIRGWSQGVLIEAYKDGLNEDMYQSCVARRDPNELQLWYVLAAEVEIDLT
uniref:Retrotransposon gag domain-containing protein n=1 Tax=Naja naja TaxID=35670 RepID=A0A8C6XGC2_NAJNA